MSGATPRPALRPSGGRLGSLLIALAGVALVLLASELVVRRWIESPSTALGSRRYGFVQPPHVRIVHSSEGWSDSRTNAMGLFDDELQSHPAHRALLLGDSFAEALQVPRTRNFQSVAERLLPGWEIVNVGLSGRNPIQYADWLDEFGVQLEPDVVLVQINDGDIDDLAFALAHPGSNGMMEAAGNENERGLKRLAHGVLQHSALATLVYRRIKALIGYERTRLAHRFTHLAAATAESDRHPPVDPRIGPMMDALYRRMSAHGRPIVFVYIPAIEYFDGPCAPRYPERREFFREFMARNHARWDAASVERGLEVLLATDRAAKDTRVSSEEQLLSSIVCALCAPTRHAAA